MPDEDAESETEQDVSELARSVVQELEPGTMIEDKLILSRRQALAIATGTVSASALLGFATGTADAQTAAGQVGTQQDRVDVFAGAVDANSVNTIKSTTDQLSLVLKKDGTDQSIAQLTEAPVEWDTQELDSDIYDYDTGTNQITVLEPGDYRVECIIRYDDISAGDSIFARLLVNNTIEYNPSSPSASSFDTLSAPFLLRDLSANDTITIAARTTSTNGATIRGLPNPVTAAFITREG